MASHRNGGQEEPQEEVTASINSKPQREWKQIEKWLGSINLHEALIAMEALDHQEARADNILQTIVHRTAESYRKSRRQLRLSLFLLGLASVIVLWWNILRPGFALSLGTYLLMPGWLAIPCCLVWRDNYKMQRRRLSNAMALLHRLSRPVATPEIIEVLEVGDVQTSSLAAKTLIRLLPQLTEADQTMLQPRHHVALQRALYGYDIDLILVILQTYEKLSDPIAIAAVRRLTRCPIWIAESEKVREAAHKTLAVLEASSRSQDTSQTLLRASDQYSSSGEELLRQTTSPAVEVLQLLRASDTTMPDAIQERRRS